MTDHDGSDGQRREWARLLGVARAPITGPGSVPQRERHDAEWTLAHLAVPALLARVAELEAENERLSGLLAAIKIPLEP